MTLKLDNLFLTKNIHTMTVTNTPLEMFYRECFQLKETNKMISVFFLAQCIEEEIQYNDIYTFLLKKCMDKENTDFVADILKRCYNEKLNEFIIQIYHPTLEMNLLAKTDNRSYYHAAAIDVNNIDMWFMSAQNDFNTDYQKFKIRSTSVGDVVLIQNKYYIVKGTHLSEVKNNVDFHILQAEII
jgi:hypothetical protein